MVIRHNDRISTVIGRDESLVDVFVSLSPAFERLRDSSMRKVMARLVTVEQAASMAGVDADLLVARLNAHIAGKTGSVDGLAEMADAPEGAAQAADGASQEVPLALARIPADQRIEIDVRPELRAGNEPFSQIMAARRRVPEGGALAVRAIFDPVPLYAVMRKQGFGHFTERLGDEDWRVWFYPLGEVDADPIDPPASEAATPLADPASPADPSPDAGADAGVVVLDVRGMEPPEPMMHTLTALETLPEGGTLVQLNARVPRFLLPLLEERGFTYEIREQDPGLVRVFIRHRTA